MLYLDPNSGISLQRLRTKSVPELGNGTMASWRSLMGAMKALDVPFELCTELIEVTREFQIDKQSIMLSLLKQGVSRRAFVVSALVHHDGGPPEGSTHCLAFSTVPTLDAPFGMMIDNYSRSKPLYIEQKDSKNNARAKRAFQLLFAQRRLHITSVDAKEVREVLVI